MLYALCSMLFVCGFAANAAPAAEDFITRDVAVIRVMDKAAGRARTLHAPVGVRTEWEKLEILVRACRDTQPFAAHDSFMFVEIAKRATPAAPRIRIFSGWMTASAPGDNPLQDAEYDLWLTRCE